MPLWRAGLHLLAAALLTVLTQLGGLAFVLIYGALSVAALFIAPLFGRVALSCMASGPLQVQSWMYCALNRTYVAPDLRDALQRVAAQVDAAHPGTVTQVLDAGFPFFDGVPLLPHLSHDDGDKADLAFYYRNSSGYLPGVTASPIGYFAFEDGPTQCRPSWPSLRWDMGALQPLWPEYDLDDARLRAVLRALVAEPRIGKVLIEPHLTQRLGLSHPKIRFQGCRAARHDDHIHVQL